MNINYEVNRLINFAVQNNLIDELLSLIHI